jgi:signal peptidase I
MKRDIPATPSSYYPPRARWYGRLRYPWIRIRSELRLDWLTRPAGLTTWHFLLALLVPGYAFFAFGRRRLGWLAFAVYAVAAASFIMGFGFETVQFGGAGSTFQFQPCFLAFGLMIAAHATSVTLVFVHLLQDFRFGRQVFYGLLATVFLSVFIYFPALRYTEAHWLVPLQIHGRVVFVSRLAKPQSIRCGDWVAYTLSATRGSGIWVNEGYAFGPVLGMPGDKLEFQEGSFAVNGRLQPGLPRLPTTGDLTVPQNRWFIWPDLGITGHGVVREDVIVEQLLSLALVDQDAFVGKPFKRWFLRKQVLP